jgi:hypothetical protein
MIATRIASSSVILVFPAWQTPFIGGACNESAPDQSVTSFIQGSYSDGIPVKSNFSRPPLTCSQGGGPTQCEGC